MGIEDKLKQDSIRTFQIRWNDLDPNRHVANSSISALMNERRMLFLAEHGITQAFFEKHQIGPAILSEHFYYLKEIQPGSKVHIDIELLANTPDFKYISFCHALYNEAGRMAVFSTMVFTWMDLKARKAIVPPDELLQINDKLRKSDQYRVMTEAEIRATPVTMVKTDAV
jgi:acyl-CoA thioester hydrolase